MSCSFFVAAHADRNDKIGASKKKTPSVPNWFKTRRRSLLREKRGAIVRKMAVGEK
jgi:hypothetical protein